MKLVVHWSVTVQQQSTTAVFERSSHKYVNQAKLSNQSRYYGEKRRIKD